MVEVALVGLPRRAEVLTVEGLTLPEVRPAGKGAPARLYGRRFLQRSAERPRRLPLGTVGALLGVCVAAALLVRAGNGAGNVFPAGAAGTLLTTADLGSSWSEGGLTFDLGAIPTAAYDPNGFARGNCGRTAASPTADATAARSATFNTGNRFLSQQVGIFPSATVAHERYAAYRSALAACRTWTVTTAEGGQLALRLDPVAGHQTGEESGVYRLEGSVSPAKSGLASSTSVEAAVVVMRRLNAVSVIAEMSVGYLGQQADARTSDTTLAASVADSKLAGLATVRGPLKRAAGPARNSTQDAATLTRSSSSGQQPGLAIGSPTNLSSNDGGKVSVSVQRVVDPATGQDGYSPKPGYRFVGVLVRLGNVGEKVYDDSPENGALLIDDHGEQHYADLAEITDGGGFGGHVTMQNEDIRTGFIVFQLPQGVAPRTFQFALDSGFAPTMGQWVLSK